jgi:hypothetical protein
MLFKLAAPAVLGIALIIQPVAAQTVAEQLQKGIYAQETAGDLDGAIAIYRTILGSSQNQRDVSATAQYRLAQALLQKGDLDGASREFQKLALGYSDYKDLIAGMTGRMSSVMRNSRVTLGRMQNGRYRHALTGVELTPPDGFSVIQDTDSSDGGEMVVLARPGIMLEVWLKPEDQMPGDLAASVRRDLERKPSQRPAGWKVRPESIRTGGSADRQWLSAVAEFTVEGHNAVEMVTWYRTTKVHAFFFAEVAAADAAKYQDRFNQLVQTAVIP